MDYAGVGVAEIGGAFDLKTDMYSSLHLFARVADTTLWSTSSTPSRRATSPEHRGEVSGGDAPLPFAAHPRGSRRRTSAPGDIAELRPRGGSRGRWCSCRAGATPDLGQSLDRQPCLVQRQEDEDRDHHGPDPDPERRAGGKAVKTQAYKSLP